MQLKQSETVDTRRNRHTAIWWIQLQ